MKMKTKEEYEKQWSKCLLPIGSQVVYMYPKSDDFMQTGIIVKYFPKSGGFYWDYEIKLYNGKIINSDKSMIELT
jgi:hypothetical protein